MPRKRHLTVDSDRRFHKRLRNRSSDQGQRVDSLREYARQVRENENEDQRNKRLCSLRNYHEERRMRESERERRVRLCNAATQERIRRLNRRNNRGCSYNIGKGFQSDSDVQEFALGQMCEKCDHCHAKHFAAEKTSGGFSICCHKGKVSGDVIPPIETPELLKRLLMQNDEETKHYLMNIRNYNNALAFASVQGNVLKIPNRGPYCFKIQGQMYHSVGSLHPESNRDPMYAGLFILDAEESLTVRLNKDTNKQCRRSLMTTLMNLLHDINPYANLFRHMIDVESSMKEENPSVVPTYQLTFTENNGFDKRRYNPSRIQEIAAVFLSDDGSPPSNISFAIHSKAENQMIRTISALNPHSDPMSYPLLFPYGEASWKRGMNHNSVFTTSVRNVVTQLQYYCYCLAVRDTFSLLHSSGKLFQQFIVDAYVKVESARMSYIKSHQKEIRRESYKGLMDFLCNESEQRGTRVGLPVVLPSTFIGSPRNMMQNYQDAMSIVGRYGKPDLFITFTANPRWSEITDNIPPYQKIEHRPDLISRVFYLKLQELMRDLTEKHIFGTVAAHIHVIEFQKRGLPHAHILIILKEEDKPREVEHIDSIVVAELPDKVANPILFEIVTKFMIHGPCGTLNPLSPCMDNSVCTKDFPKQFIPETQSNIDGYPLYRRRDNGQAIFVKNIKIDNRWVVPYNPYLTLKFNAHINVEVCSSIKSIKYIFKYVYKGYDCAALKIQNNSEGESTVSVDEVTAHLNTRYVSPPEAVWRLHERYMHKRSHCIERLPVHLPAEQMLYFQPGAEQETLDIAHSRKSKLMAWFELNSIDADAREYLYKDIPEHYIWVNHKWQKRKRFSNCIGRMYTVNPSDRERFFLRILLLHKRGAISFDDLRKVNGQICDNFSSAVKAMNLVEDDDEWERCLEEASLFGMPRQLRDLFAFICIFSCPHNIRDLWENFKNVLSEDYKLHNNEEMSYNLALRDLDNVFNAHGKNCTIFQLPAPVAQLNTEPLLNYRDDVDQGTTLYQLLNNDQKRIADEVLQTIRLGLSSSWYVDGPGGAGKTFLYKCLTHILRGEGKQVIPVAWTGIAANLIEGGRTAHSVFKFPVPLLETSVSSMRPNSLQAENLRNASLIIWDEVSMVPKTALKVFDRLLKDIMQSEEIFGGKCILFGGDFRQILPVVRKGNRVTICEETLKNSPLWKYIRQFKLTKNMRALKDIEFSKWLLQLGDGILPIHHETSTIEIPQKCIYNGDIISFIYDQEIRESNIEYFFNRGILCPRNEDCSRINEKIVSEMIVGESRMYCSVDSVILSDNERDQQLYPTEFLNTLNPSGLPPHKLILKNGAIVMLLRNLDTKRGLVNGTRLVVKKLHVNSIEAQVLTGEAKSNVVLIPRIELSPSDPTMPFMLKRRQFPIRLAFAMTINKSQGQTFDKIGIFLPCPVFTHGQLYVAFSRVKSFDDVKVQIIEKPNQGKLKENEQVFTSNVVYQEILK